ncbi:MAG: hypothetical protein AVDCRST_MAG03-2245, partial [uncultured Rubrobacteraceae bacterium]
GAGGESHSSPPVRRPRDTAQGHSREPGVGGEHRGRRAGRRRGGGGRTDEKAPPRRSGYGPPHAGDGRPRSDGEDTRGAAGGEGARAHDVRRALRRPRRHGGRGLRVHRKGRPRRRVREGREARGPGWLLRLPQAQPQAQRPEALGLVYRQGPGDPAHGGRGQRRQGDRGSRLPGGEDGETPPGGDAPRPRCGEPDAPGRSGHQTEDLASPGRL